MCASLYDGVNITERRKKRQLNTPIPHNEDKRLSYLRDLRLDLSSHFDEIQGLCEVASHLAGAPIALVSLLDETHQNFLASVGVGDLKQTGREIAFCAYAIMASPQLEVTDACLDDRFAENPLVVGAPGIRSYLGTVLEPEPAMRLGTLCVLDTKPRIFSDDVKDSLSKIGQAISAILVSYRERVQLIDFSKDIIQKNAELAATSHALQRSIEMLAVAEGIKDEFVSTITHELITPLTSIKGALSLMKTDAVLENKHNANRLISIAHENTERLLTLVNDILNLHKSSAGDQVLKFSPVDLADLIQLSVKATKNESAKRAITLTVLGATQPCLVNGDRKLLELVITNVLSNAIKYARSGGNVDINLNRFAAGPQITVTDDGAGIPQGSKSKVFGMFSQVEGADTRTHSGIGLGMYMCRKILQAHRSTIDYTSTVGIGTTFALSFPKIVNQESLCG